MSAPHRAPVSDEAVSRMPLAEGRAALLEEIVMSTPVLDRPTTDRPDRPGRRDRAVTARSRRLVPLAAAAAVVLLAGLGVAGAQWSGEPGEVVPAPVAPAAPPAVPPTAQQDRVLLVAPGWQVQQVDTVGGAAWSKGDAKLDVSVRPAASYDAYVADRERLVAPPAAGRPLEVLGAPGQLWSYAEDDHAVIREVSGGSFVEVRGSRVSLSDFRGLLDSLQWVDEATFAGSLPSSYLTEAERPVEVARHLDGIRDALGDLPLLPAGTPEVTSAAADPYILGVDVADSVVCAWLATYHRADGAGREARTAAQVLATLRDWPVLEELVEIAPEGEYSSGPWALADELAAGGTPAGWAERLGCSLTD